VLNSGSCSQKSALHEIQGALPVHPPTPAWQGKIEWNGDQAEMQVQNSKGLNLKHRLKVESRRHAIEQLLNSLWTGDTLPFK
jgi:acetate kinase